MTTPQQTDVVKETDPVPTEVTIEDTKTDGDDDYSVIATPVTETKPTRDDEDDAELSLNKSAARFQANTAALLQKMKAYETTKSQLEVMATLLNGPQEEEEKPERRYVKGRYEMTSVIDQLTHRITVLEATVASLVQAKESTPNPLDQARADFIRKLMNEIDFKAME